MESKSKKSNINIAILEKLDGLIIILHFGGMINILSTLIYHYLKLMISKKQREEKEQQNILTSSEIRTFYSFLKTSRHLERDNLQIKFFQLDLWLPGGRFLSYCNH